MRFKLSLILDAIYPTVIYLVGMITIVAAIFTPEIPEFHEYDPNAVYINWENIIVLIVGPAILLMFINIFISNDSINAYQDLWLAPERGVKIMMILTVAIIIIATCTDGLFMLATLFFILPGILMVKHCNVLFKSIKFPLNYEEEILGKSKEEMKESLLAKYPKVKKHILNY